mgnify:CR=1 FL=1
MAPRLDPNVSNVSNEVIASFAIEADQAQRDIDEASGRKRAILKRAKGQGVKTDIILAVLAMKKQDEADVLARMRDTLRYAAIIVPNVKLSQADLFDTLDTKPLNARSRADVQEWEAERKGYECGLIGGSMGDCVYAPGTEARVHFERGFVRGQTVIADRMGENAKKADPSRTKRRGANGLHAVPDQEELDGTD